MVINNKTVLTLILLVATVIGYIQTSLTSQIALEKSSKITLLTAITKVRASLPEGYKLTKILGLTVDASGTSEQWALVGCHNNGDWRRFDVNSQGVQEQNFLMRMKSISCAKSPDLLEQHIADSTNIVQVLENIRKQLGLPIRGLISTITTDLVLIDNQLRYIWRISGQETNNIVAQLGGSTFKLNDQEVTTCGELEAIYDIELSSCEA